MKKNFILLAAVLGIGTVSAQTIFEKTNTTTIKNSKPKLNSLDQLNRSFDWTTHNRGKDVNTFASFEETTNNRKGSEKNDLLPFGSINAERWTYGTNVDTNETVMFSLDSKYGQNASFTFKTYTDDLKVDKQFTISIPESANRAEPIGDFSSKILDNNSKLIVGVYVHYFEGGQGPAFQKHQIWFVNEDGEILYKVDASSAEVLRDSKGNLNLFTYDSGEDYFTVKKINLNNTANNLEYKVPFDLLNYYVGMPLAHKNLNGKDYLVFSHFTEKLLDNSTLEFNKNAKFTLDFIDIETFNLDKTYTLPVIGFDEENPYTIPMTTVGLFYITVKYDM